MHSLVDSLCAQPWRTRMTLTNRTPQLASVPRTTFPNAVGLGGPGRDVCPTPRRPRTGSAAWIRSEGSRDPALKSSLLSDLGTGAEDPATPLSSQALCPPLPHSARPDPFRTLCPTHPCGAGAPRPLRGSSACFLLPESGSPPRPQPPPAGLPHPPGTSSSFLAFPVTNTSSFPAKEAAMVSMSNLAVSPEAPLPRVAGISGRRRKGAARRPA